MRTFKFEITRSLYSQNVSLVTSDYLNINLYDLHTASIYGRCLGPFSDRFIPFGRMPTLVTS